MISRVTALPSQPREADMGFDAHMLKVLIASPSDTTRERDAIEKTLYGTESFPRDTRPEELQRLNNFQAQTAPRIIAR